METGEIIALDIGEKKIGVARASRSARIAEPLVTLPADGALEKITELINKNNVQAVIVGLPRNLSGEDTPQTKWVRDWVTKAKARIEVPLYWQDEALTSQKAESFKLKAKNSIDEHALAAAIILQDFLDTDKRERVLA